MSKKPSPWLAGVYEWMSTLPRAPLSDYEGSPAGGEVVFHHVQDVRPAPAPSPAPAPTPARTDPDEVRRAIERVRAEMRADREGAAVRRRIRTEIARDFRYAIAHPPPEPYTLALERRSDAHTRTAAEWRPDGSCPEPYTIALQARKQA